MTFSLKMMILGRTGYTYFVLDGITKVSGKGGELISVEFIQELPNNQNHEKGLPHKSASSLSMKNTQGLNDCISKVMAEKLLYCRGGRIGCLFEVT